MIISKTLKEEIMDYVLSQESLEGGFSFSKTTPPTLEDTYFALRIFDELGIAYNSQKTIKYIKNVPLLQHDHIKHTYYLAYARYILHINESSFDEHLNKFVKDIHPKKIEDIYYLLKISELTHIQFIYNEKYALYLNHERYISQIREKMFILSMLGKPIDKKSYVRIIRGFQNGDGGFGFHQGTTSFLENTYDALYALTILHSNPQDIDACEKFVHACKSKSGFGRQIYAVPTLEYTYYALSSLKMIQEMRKCSTQ